MDEGFVKNKAFQKILFISAHPDDNEFFSGGTILKLLEKKKSVIFLILTFGSKAKFTGLNEKTLIKERKKEAEKEALSLGVKKVLFLGKTFIDGKIVYNEDTISEVLGMVKKICPDLIICPAYKHCLCFWNRDHKRAGELAEGAGVRLKIPVIFYGGYRPDYLVNVDKQYKKTTKAIKYHKTQMHFVGKMYLFLRNRLGKFFGKKRGCTYAEPFEKSAEFFKRKR